MTDAVDSVVKQVVSGQVVPAGLRDVQELATSGPCGADGVAQPDELGTLKGVNVPLSKLDAERSNPGDLSDLQAGVKADDLQDGLPVRLHAISTRQLLLTLAVRVFLVPPYLLYFRFKLLKLHLKIFVFRAQNLVFRAQNLILRLQCIKLALKLRLLERKTLLLKRRQRNVF